MSMTWEHLLGYSSYPSLLYSPLSLSQTTLHQHCPFPEIQLLLHSIRMHISQVPNWQVHKCWCVCSIVAVLLRYRIRKFDGQVFLLQISMLGKDLSFRRFLRFLDALVVADEVVICLTARSIRCEVSVRLLRDVFLAYVAEVTPALGSGQLRSMRVIDRMMPTLLQVILLQPSCFMMATEHFGHFRIRASVIASATAFRSLTPSSF